ncbi:MAG: DUF6152 family protein [Rhodospirillaceae bacterium]|nr:DUF6152 family protein [Rhodospirillaceae bacterium]
MRIQAKYTLFSAAMLMVAGSAPALAHHSFAAEFDANRPVHLDGVVVMFEWVNPHSWLHIDVTTEDGTVERWRVEGGAPSTLLRRGWNRNSLPAGTRVTVDGFQAKDGSPRANARDIVFPDGRRLFLGSTRIGAPYDDEAEE